MVAASVAGDRAQIAAGAIGDAIAARHVPPRIADPADGQPPGNGAGRVDGRQRARRRDREVQPPRRPARLRPGSEPPHRAAGGDDPRTAPAGHEHPARGRQRQTRHPGDARAGERAVDDPVHRRARRGERHRRDQRRHQWNGGHRSPAPCGGAWRTVHVRRLDGAPGTRLGAGLVGRAHSRERALRGRIQPPAHGPSFSTSWALSASSPRRRREFTVPRGKSSARAISPGVYSRTWRSTTTARCSGLRLASAAITSSE
jgi:hypothetical protein